MPTGATLGAASALLAAVVTEVYAHRCLAHRAFAVHPRLARVLDGYFQVVVGTHPTTWAAVHRLHHRYADTPRDPHSPIQRPAAAVLLGSPLLFARARRRLPPGGHAGRGPVHLVVRVTAAAALAVAIGPDQLAVMVAVHLAGYLGVMGLVNTVGHLHGRKPHPEVPGFDAPWLAIPLLGHGYHNSHHAHPGAARTGPLDPIWPLLRLLAATGAVDLGARMAPRHPARCCAATALVSGG